MVRLLAAVDGSLSRYGSLWVWLKTLVGLRVVKGTLRLWSSGVLATLSRWRSRVRSPSDALSVVTARKCYVVCCLCPGEPSRDGYIVECVVCIVWEVCADDPSSFTALVEMEVTLGSDPSARKGVWVRVPWAVRFTEA